MTIPPRIAVTPAQIDQVVTAFYGCVRNDKDLGPVFAAHVEDWPSHESKISAFWRNALLYERVYDGNPMQVHKSSGHVKAEHFAVWLTLFDQVLAAQLPPELAQGWSALAHRIGRGLRFGLCPSSNDAGVPMLG